MPGPQHPLALLPLAPLGHAPAADGSVAVAVNIGSVYLAAQAIDGTKVIANASGDRTCDEVKLARLLDRAETAIASLEAQNETDEDVPPPPMPPELRKAHRLKEQVQTARERLREKGRKQVVARIAKQ